MKNKTYSEKFRSPKWQKKRLEILERDNFTCQICKSKESTLNVHHGYYEKDKNPWEYENETLYTLCEQCHKDHHRRLKRVNFILAHFTPSEFDVLYDSLFLHLGRSKVLSLGNYGEVFREKANKIE